MRHAWIRPLLLLSLLALPACASLPGPFSTSMGMPGAPTNGRAGDTAAAAGLYRRAHLADPAALPPLVGLGQVMNEAGAYQEAAAAFGRAVAVAPQDAEARRGLGAALLGQGAPELALAELQQALGMVRDVRTLSLIGVAHDMLGDHAAAQATYQAGLDLDAGSVGLRNNLGLSLALAGNLDAVLARDPAALGTGSCRLGAGAPEPGPRPRPGRADRGIGGALPPRPGRGGGAPESRLLRRSDGAPAGRAGAGRPAVAAPALPQAPAPGYMPGMVAALTVSRPAFARTETWAALALAVLAFGALGVALAAEYWGGLPPCKLCLYQRYPLLVTGLFALGAAVARPAWGRMLLAIAGLGFLASAGVAAFHVGVEQGWWQGPTTCSTPGGTPDDLDALRRQILGTALVRCDQVPWSLFGLSIAGYNLLFSGTVGALALAAGLRRRLP